VKFERIKVDSSIEKRILTGAIVSTKYLEKVFPLFNKEYVENTFIRKVLIWVCDFYTEYGKSPGASIKDIFLAEKKKLREDEIEIIETIVNDILSGYSESDFGDEYFIDQAISFFKERELTITANNMKYYLEKGNVEEAEKELENYHRIIKPTLTENCFITDEASISKTFTYMEDDTFLKLPKSLGKFMGSFQRGWLVGLSAPFKKGKTWMLGEFLKCACMSGLRVASFNLEMNINNMRKRTYMSLTGASDAFGQTLFPCFDCVLNQMDRCDKSERMNRIKIPHEFDKRSKYRPCTYCKDTFGENEFEMAFWNEIIDVPRLDYFGVLKHLTALKKIGKARIWLECMPRFSASVSDIERKLDNLEDMHNFVPDVLLIDYADILRADDPHLKGVEKEDNVWMELARISSVRNCCTIVPTQLNKDSLDAKQIKTSHTSKWIGKLGHVDAMYALNQIQAEKDMNIMRVSCLEHRHKDFSDKDNCYVLQKYSSGQAHLDSYWKEKKRKD
jgi:hypothetical protein